MSITITTFITV